jgi:tetratricopeptide (TPR) repeat protein
MPGYFFSARDPSGREVTERVEAPTADSAVERLREEGYQEIVLHTDDVWATLRAGESVRPRQFVRVIYFRDYLDRVAYGLDRFSPWLTGLSLLLIVWDLATGAGISKLQMIVIAAALVVPLLSPSKSYYRVWEHAARGRWDKILTVGFLVGGILFLVWNLLAGSKVNALELIVIGFALLWPLVGPGARYYRVVEHAAWGRWKEVLRTLPELSPWLRGLLAHELALRKAQALAGLGDLREGLAVFQPYEKSGVIPPWLYYSRLSEIYFAARDWDQAVAARERAVKVAPDIPSALLDLATALLRYKHDIARAKDLIDRAKAHPIIPQLAPGLAWAEGLLELERGDAQAAKQRLEAALEAANDRWAGNPIGRLQIDLIHADLAVALGRLGDIEQALCHFRRAEPRLVALGRDQLIRQCEEAIGMKLSADVPAILAPIEDD